MSSVVSTSSSTYSGVNCLRKNNREFSWRSRWSQGPQVRFNRVCRIGSQMEVRGQGEGGSGISMDQKQSIGLLDFPVEILEQILENTGAYGALSLGSLDPRVSSIVEACLDRIGEKDPDYWRKRCFEEIPMAFLEVIMTSFYNLVEERYRNYSDYPIDPSKNGRFQYNWEDVFRTCWGFKDLLKNFNLRLKVQNQMESVLKMEFFLKSNHPNVGSDGPPFIFIKTAGNLLACVRSRFPGAVSYDFTVFEDMMTCYRAQRFLLNTKKENGEIPQRVLVMTLPFPTPENDPEEAYVDGYLPKVHNVAVIITKVSILLASFHEGATFRINTDPILPFQDFETLITPVAIERDWLGAWISPSLYRLYKVSVKARKGDIDALRQFDVSYPGMDAFWQHVATFPTAFQPILIPVQSVPVWLKESPNQKFPVFAINSPIHGIHPFPHKPPLTFWLRLIENPSLNAPDGVNIKAFHQKPILYPMTLTLDEFRARFPRRPEGRTSGYGLTVFWSNEILLVQYDLIKWIVADWKVLLGFKPGFVESIEIFAPDCLMILVFRRIVLAEMKVITETRTKDGKLYMAPKIMFEIIRVIEMPDETLYLNAPGFVRDCSLGFDRGIPYIYFVHSVGKTITWPELRFYLEKIEFVDPEDPPKGGYKDEAPKSAKFVVAETKKPICVGIFQVFGQGDSSWIGERVKGLGIEVVEDEDM